jgi:hypothetical protein
VLKVIKVKSDERDKVASIPAPIHKIEINNISSTNTNLPHLVDLRKPKTSEGMRIHDSMTRNSKFENNKENSFDKQPSY